MSSYLLGKCGVMNVLKLLDSAEAPSLKASFFAMAIKNKRKIIDYETNP